MNYRARLTHRESNYVVPNLKLLTFRVNGTAAAILSFENKTNCIYNFVRDKWLALPSDNLNLFGIVLSVSYYIFSLTVQRIKLIEVKEKVQNPFFNFDWQEISIKTISNFIR